MSADFRIRVATPLDNSQIGDLLSRSYPELMAGSYDPIALAAALPFMTRPIEALLSSGTFYLAETKDRSVVGCGGWTRERPGSGKITPELAHIRHFATHPNWAQQGVGRALYENSMNAARSAGIERFECFSSLNAESFYAALGFNTMHRIDLPLGPDGILFPSVLMERLI